MNDDLKRLLHKELDMCRKACSPCGTGTQKSWERLESVARLINECQKTKALDRVAQNLVTVAINIGRR